MRLIYSRPMLDDLSQGSRIAFARQFRFMSQDELSDMVLKVAAGEWVLEDLLHWITDHQL